MITCSQIPATLVGQNTKMKPVSRGVVPVKAGALASVVDDWYLNRPHVSTVIGTFTWAALEAVRGVYDFSTIDTEITRCRVAGKTMILRVMTNYATGEANPAWIWTTAAPPGPCFKRTVAETDLTVYSAYEPWDTTWLPSYTLLMAALARKYDDNPTVAAVVISGYNGKYTELVTRNDNLAPNWDDVDTGTATGVAHTTMTDTAAAWAVNALAGYVVTMGGRTLTITSNTGTPTFVATGTAGWQGGADPAAGAYSIQIANVAYSDAAWLGQIKLCMAMMHVQWPRTLLLFRGVKTNIPRGRFDVFAMYDELAAWARNAIGMHVSFGTTGIDDIDDGAAYLAAHPPKTITNATNATPIVISAASHGFDTGDSGFVQGVIGNTAANGVWTFTKLTGGTFSLDGSVGNGAWGAGAGQQASVLGDPVYYRVRDKTPDVRHMMQVGKVVPPTQATVGVVASLSVAARAHHCEVGPGDYQHAIIASSAQTAAAATIDIITSAAHPFATSDVISVEGHSVAAANGTWTITKVSNTRFTLQGSTWGANGTGGDAFDQGVDNGWRDAAGLAWVT